MTDKIIYYGLKYRLDTRCPLDCKHKDCTNCEKLKKYIEEQENAKHKEQ